jgi:peptidoglycan/xylan/chitin deacetylase (PgdA/CDA1 family)
MKNRFSDPPRVMTSRCRDARFAGICWLLIVAVVMTLAVPVVSLVTAPPAQADTSCPDPAGAVLTRTSAAFPRNVALTFDDGPSGSWTPQVLDVLRANGIRATFFLIGENVRQNPALVRRTLAEGHQIGNHTDTHPTLTGLTAEQQAQQMDAAQASIVAADGVQPCYFRAPGGSYNSTTVALARARGMSVVGWSNDTEDWAAPLTVSTAYQAKIVDQAINPVYDHPIVLMHDGSPGNYRQNTVDSLQRVIDSYRSRGYVFTDPMGRNADRGSDPIGHLDVANSPAPGKVRVAGWAFDPSAPTDPVPIHVYINDVGYARSTGAPRPDVKAVYSQTSANQGFDLTLPATGGVNRVGVFAIDVGNDGANTLLNYREVLVN